MLDGLTMKKLVIATLMSSAFLAPTLAHAEKPGAKKTSANASSYMKRKELKAFINKMVSKHKFKRSELNALFKTVKPQPKIIKAMNTPWESKAWYQYRPLFIKANRIEPGAAFMKAHAKWLKKAEEKYGVPPEIITAIIGVESRYGKYKGKDRIIESLATLSFDYPRRAKFFTKEMEEFLLLAREEKLDAKGLKGSYAGAMGLPQFISSSYRAYAVDFDNDGTRDLFNSLPDVIGSVGNYFKRHGWKKGMDVAYPAIFNGKKVPSKIKASYKTENTGKALKNSGFITDTILNTTSKYSLLEFKLKDGHEYWVGTSNFYTITRYNHSKLYAMAVYQLSKEIAAEHAQP